MKPYLTIGVLITLFITSPARADDTELQQKIDSVRAQIEMEESQRDRLREDLSEMDKKVENLRQQLEELEARISDKQN